MAIVKLEGADDVRINLSAEQVADLFCQLDDREQAHFFNAVDKLASVWALGGLTMQLQYVTDAELTLGGRRVMQMIGEYSHLGLVPKATLPELLTSKEEELRWNTHLGFGG